jgi:hypothetical protein
MPELVNLPLVLKVADDSTIQVVVTSPRRVVGVCVELSSYDEAWPMRRHLCRAAFFYFFLKIVSRTVLY